MTVPGGSQQLLGEEGVPVGARPDSGHELRVRVGSEDAPHQFVELLLGKGRQFEEADAPATKFSQPTQEWMVGGQAVVAVGGHHHHADFAGVGQEEGEEIARGLVSPLEVLHHQDDGGACREPLGQSEDQLEEVGPAPAPGDELVVGPPPGKQCGHLGPERSDQIVDVVGIEAAEQSPKGVEERPVRRAGVLEFDAAADQDGGAASRGLPGEVTDEPCLAHPALAGNDHRRGAAGIGRLQRRHQAGDLPSPADEHGADPGRGLAVDGRAL